MGQPGKGLQQNQVDKKNGEKKAKREAMRKKATCGRILRRQVDFFFKNQRGGKKWVNLKEKNALWGCFAGALRFGPKEIERNCDRSSERGESETAVFHTWKAHGKRLASERKIWEISRYLAVCITKETLKLIE
ncbi:MAG: hypothetical protein SOW80_03885 [Anaerovoracaceae bacterium]|nr:hypothetical protein [Anaerovoracaceae bacterium]